MNITTNVRRLARLGLSVGPSTSDTNNNTRTPVTDWLDSLRGSSVKNGAIQRILAWPLRKDNTHKSRSVSKTRTPGSGT